MTNARGIADTELKTQRASLTSRSVASAIGIVPTPCETGYGTYMPYDRVLRDVPSLYVDRDLTAELTALADGTTEVTLTLPAIVESVMTRNIVAVIPASLKHGQRSDYAVTG